MQNQNQDASWNAFDNMPEEEEGLDIWGFLRRRKAFIILLAMVGAGIGYLWFQRQIPRYNSSAILQVIHRDTDRRVEELMVERNLSDTQYVINSPMLLKTCIEKHNLAQLETLRGLSMDSAVSRIAGMCRANQAPKTNILKISCEGANASDTAEIANAVAKEFIHHQTEGYEGAVSKLQQLLTRAKDELRSSLDELDKEFLAWEGTSPLDLDGNNVHRTRLTQIEQKISSLVIAQTELKAELTGLERALREGGQKEALMLLVGKATESRKGTNPKNVDDAVSSEKSAYEAVMPMLMDEALLMERLGSGHPRLAALRRRIEVTRDHVETHAGFTREKDPESGELAPRPDFLTIYLDSLRQELSLMAEKQASLVALSNAEEAEAKSMRTFELTNRSYNRKIERENALLDSVQAQIRNIELPTNMGGVTASILTPARHGSLVYPKLSSFLGFGAFLGGFAGLVLGYIVEIADRSFRKPDEIVREFGLPIVGHIPYMMEQKLKKIPKDTVMDRTVIAMHLPRSRPSEAYRTVRTAVCFSAVGSQHRVIQVTSPAAGDGKSTLTANFAVSLAQSGKKTILLESDFRRPKVHNLMGVSNEVGVVDVLRGDAEIADAIAQTELDNFDIMPCGSRPRNPSELLTRPEYEHLLEALREKYEYVIIDSPPVLVVTDPCSVAPRADGVLLCIRLGRHTREFGRRALEQLRDVGANITGLVVNGVEETDAYGYGNYSYSDYRYRYKDYNYGYDSYQQSGEAYFAESEDEASSSVRS